MTSKSKIFFYFAWLISLVATLGSLYFSEILHFPPCTLCWYQRIAIYPIPILLGYAILRQQSTVAQSLLLILIPGWFISLYHNLLYYHILADTYSPCSTGVSCTTQFVQYFGFITIPLLSFLATTAIILSILVAKHYEQRR